MADQTISVRLAASLTEFKAQLGVAAGEVKSFAGTVASSTGQARQGFDQMGKAGVVAGGAILAGFGMAVKAAADFEAAMRNVNTIAQEGPAGFTAMSDAVVDLSRKLPQSANELARGLYDVASSGFAGADGIKVLDASATAASAGLSTTATSAQAIVGVLNAYGMKVSDVTDISDILFQTAKAGILNFDQLASGMGDWVGTAAAAKVPLEDAGAALATITLGGIGAAEANTALNRVLLSFIKPSEAMTDALHSIGQESGSASLKTLGLKGTMDALAKAGFDNIDSMSALFPEVRGLKGALALLANEGRNYASASAQITDANARQGSTQRALEEQSKSLSFQLSIMKNNLVAIGIQIGGALLPVITPLVEAVTRVASGFAQMPGPMKLLIAGGVALVGTVLLLGGAFLLLLPRIQLAQTAFAALAAESPLLAAGLGTVTAAAGGIGIALTAAATVYALFAKHQDAAVAATDRMTGAFETFARGADAAGRRMILEALAGEDLLDTLNRLGITTEAVTDIMTTHQDGSAKNVAATKAWSDALDAAVASGQLTRDEADKLSRSVFSLSNEFANVAGSAEAVNDAIAQVGDTATTSTDALDAYKKMLDGITDSAFGVEDAQDRVAGDIASMQDQFDKAQESRVASSERQYQRMADAADRVREAEERLTDAQKTAAGAKGHFASADELKAVASAQRELEKARRDQRKATRDSAGDVDEFSTSLDASTTAGLRNRDFFKSWTEDIASGAKKMKESGDFTAGEIAGWVREQETAMDKYADSWGFPLEAINEYSGVLDEIIYKTALLQGYQPFAGTNVKLTGKDLAGTISLGGFASGGLVTGIGAAVLTGMGTDTVPAALTPGEFVLTSDHRKGHRFR